MRKLIFLIAIILLPGCNENLIEPSSGFSGNWEFIYSGDLVQNHNRFIDDKSEFTWEDSTYAVIGPPPRILNEYFNIVGNVSTDGELLAIIYLSDSNPPKKCGDFYGKLTDKNGTGSFNYSISGINVNCTWTAFKK